MCKSLASLFYLVIFMNDLYSFVISEDKDDVTVMSVFKKQMRKSIFPIFLGCIFGIYSPVTSIIFHIICVVMYFHFVFMCVVMY